MQPLVSICMPTLNSRRFLEERLESIRRQSMKSWELVVMDSYSEDGTYEFLREVAKGEPRIRLYQAERDGIYSNINRCIEQARGEWIYVATSDDTMHPDCLKRMSAALEKHPESGLCHCSLTIIDENGAAVTGDSSWEAMPAQRFLGEIRNRPHVRLAPHDGLLHLCCFTVYTSLTQLLIRRRLFERYGMFLTGFGPAADFEWGMRVTLSESTIHLPDYLATWRRHEGQATQKHRILQGRVAGRFYEMASLALSQLKQRNPRLFRAIQRSPLRMRYLADQWIAAGEAFPKAPRKCLATRARLSLRHPLFALRWKFDKAGRHRLCGAGLRGLFEEECRRIAPGTLIQDIAF